jgi:putative hydrolase of the HAD superfamily
MTMTPIKAIFFDSGRTLNYPRTGHWFIPPKYAAFFQHELEAHYSKNIIRAAFKTASTYLEKNRYVMTEQEEYEQFITFYTLFFQALDYRHATERFIADIAYDAVFNDDKFVFYAEVTSVLPQLRQQFQLGVISDTWPSLKRVFAHCRLSPYFSTFIISSQLGVAKPHPKMFLTALEALQLRPHEAMFVDDNPRNLSGAATLGFHPILMDRTNSAVKGKCLQLYGTLQLLRQRLQPSPQLHRNQLRPGWRLRRITSLQDLMQTTSAPVSG